MFNSVCVNCGGPMLEGFHFKNYCKNECDLKPHVAAVEEDQVPAYFCVYQVERIRVQEGSPHHVDKSVAVDGSLLRIKGLKGFKVTRTMPNGGIMQGDMLEDSIMLRGAIQRIDIDHYKKTVVMR